MQALLEASAPYLTIVLSVLLVLAILLQQRGASVGGAFGGDNFSAAFSTRRGPELFLFRATIVLALCLVFLVVFDLLSL